MKAVFIQLIIQDEEPDPEPSGLSDFFTGVKDGRIPILDLKVNVKQMSPQLKWPDDE